MESEIDKYLNKTPEVELPGLGIQFNLPSSVYLYYKGEVEDPLRFDAEMELRVRGHIEDTRNILRRWFINPIVNPIKIGAAMGAMRDKFPDDINVQAHCFQHDLMYPQTGKLFAISKKTGLEHCMSIFADGHESGEFLQKIGKKDVMNEALSKIGISGIDATQFSGEDFADIGGFIALRRALDSGDQTVRIPTFKTNREWRIDMGKKFGLQPMETPKK